MRSTNQHLFARVPQAEIPRSTFNRSCGLKTTFDSGYLVPIFTDEALPGDTFNMKMTAFTRMATPIHPIMDNLYMDTFFFAVPLRLIWENFQKFNGEQDDPGDSTDYLVPTLVSDATTGHVNGSLSDYLGIPTQIADLEHSALWHRAYNLIYNEWFRDQNLVDSLHVEKGDGPDNLLWYPLRRRGKRHDYFTSALPWPQKGDSIDLPLGQTAPVSGTIIGDGSAPTFKNASDGTARALTMNNSGQEVAWSSQPSHNINAIWDTPRLSLTGATADLTNATASTINQLRQAFQLQKLYERDARGGTRYTEIIKSHFGITSPDARLQRPEYLGGGSSRININPIAQTSSTDGTSPQGNLAAIGVGSIDGHGFTKSFTEHCIIIGMVNVRADLTYQQGLERMFSRQTRFDFYWPSLSHIGEQTILNKEIYARGSAGDEEVFGYQERYAEYRYKPSRVTGQFRSNYAQSLDTWHLAQDFDSQPVLNEGFIQEKPPVDRVVAVTTEPEFLFDSYFDLKCARPMPVYSNPGMIDHF